MAVDEINAKGGIKSLGGAKLEMVYTDAQSKPEIGVSETERLLTDKDIVMLNGAHISAITLPASEVAERNKKIWFASVPVDENVTKRGFKYTFRTAETSAMRAETQVKFMDFLKQKQPLETVGIVYENSAYGQGIAKSWKNILSKSGYNLILDEAYDAANTQDFTPVATKIKTTNPDVILLASYTKDAILITKTFKQQKVKPKAIIVTSGGFDDPEYLKSVGNAAENFFDVSAWNSDVNRPGSKELNQRFIEKYKMPMNGEIIKEYAGIYTIADALERAASTDTEKLREALIATDIRQGPIQVYTSRIHFDATQTLPDPDLLMLQIQKVNGQMEYVTIWPEQVTRPGAQMLFPYQPAQ